MSSTSKKYKFFGNLTSLFGIALVIASLLASVFPTGQVQASVAGLQLNLSHIYCYDGDSENLAGLVEIHFVLLNVPDGVTPGSLTYVSDGTSYGPISPGNHTGNVWHFTDYQPSGYFNVTSASVLVGATTVNLHNPGDYADTYDCGESQPASASVVPGICTYDVQAGSLTPVTLTLTGASLTINGTTYNSSTLISLAPGTYPYTWTAQSGYTGSGSGSLEVGDCTPGSATASAVPGICAWNEKDGSLTPVTINLSYATLVLTNDDTSSTVGTYTSSTSVSLPPGNYSYTWEASQEDYTGSGSGSFTIGDCTPQSASASIDVGTCVFDEVDPSLTSSFQAGISLTAVILTLTNASLTIDGQTYTASTTINLAPGSYPYSWTAQSGYTGSGAGTLVVGDCTPGKASASISTGVCTWDVQQGSLTPVTLTLTGASLTINGQTYTASTTINLAPGSYPYTWSAQTGYEGSGSGTLEIGACVPPPLPSVSLVCYTIEASSYKLNVGNTGTAAGEIGYSTDLSPTIVSLGVIASGGHVELLVPIGVTTIYLHPATSGGWGESTSFELSEIRTEVCEDPMELTPFCSFVDLSQPHGWTVKNVNDFAVQFTWVYGTLTSLAPISLAAGASTSFLTAHVPSAAMQIFVDGFLLASSEPEICPAFLPLGLVGECSIDPASTHGWEVTNPNGFAVEAEWRVNGTALTGLVSIPANASVHFTTPSAAGAIVQIYFGGLEQDNASAALNCTPPELPPGTPPQTPPQVLIPETAGSTPVLIPVTGLSDDLAALAPAGMFSFGTVLFGLGMVFHGLAHRRVLAH